MLSADGARIITDHPAPPHISRPPRPAPPRPAPPRPAPPRPAPPRPACVSRDSLPPYVLTERRVRPHGGQCPQPGRSPYHRPAPDGRVLPGKPGGRQAAAAARGASLQARAPRTEDRELNCFIIYFYFLYFFFSNVFFIFVLLFFQVVICH